MVALVQQLDAVGFFVRPQLGVFTASALVLQVFRNRFRCHGSRVPELFSPKLSNCDQSMKSLGRQENRVRTGYRRLAAS
jgi:hypothetical protein